MGERDNMKAWFVWADDDWGDYVHGNNATEAKSMFWKEWSSETEWINLRPVRCPKLDNIPITEDKICKLHPEYAEWNPICRCKICSQN